MPAAKSEGQLLAGGVGPCPCTSYSMASWQPEVKMGVIFPNNRAKDVSPF